MAKVSFFLDRNEIVSDGNNDVFEMDALSDNTFDLRT
jgi:hypothetical protein